MYEDERQATSRLLWTSPHPTPQANYLTHPTSPPTQLGELYIYIDQNIQYNETDD